MDWDSAKRIVIWILLALNIGLFALNYEKSRQYYITPEQEKAIFQVLSERNIRMYTQLVEKYAPMGMLAVNVNTPETASIIDKFFEPGEGTSVSMEFDKTIIRSDTKTLTVENNLYTLICRPQGEPVSDFSYDAAKKLADSFLRKMGESSRFVLDSGIKKDDSYIFTYYNDYQGWKVFCGGCVIEVSNRGVTGVSMADYTPEGMEGEKQQICSADEALLTFMKEAVKDGEHEEILIERMELGYDLQDKTDIAEGRRLRLIPCYHIYVASSDEPVKINAYTNELLLGE